MSVRGLTVERAGRVVLEDVSLSVPARSVTALLGLAGAGKTSLLAAIAGLLPLARGAVFQGGTEITQSAEGRRGIGFLAPGTFLPQGRQVQAALRRLAATRDTASVDDRIQQLALSHVAARPTGTLSHGEQSLALTAARLGPPGDALLVDEAGMGLDETAQSSLQAALRRVADEGRLVLLATRSPAVALTADYLVLLSEGRVLQAGSPASLYDEPCCAAAARLTGRANILTGAVRELRPGHFVWAAGGRFVQASRADTPRPALGSPISLCLRPERVTLSGLQADSDNAVDGTIVDVRSAGPLVYVLADTPLGRMQISVPSWGIAPYPAAGQPARLGWHAGACHVLGKA